MKKTFFLFYFFCSFAYSSELIVFDVGQGNCNLFVPVGNGFPTLYDAGSTRSPVTKDSIKITKATVIKEITEKIRSIMPAHKTLNVVISHGHTDHYSYIVDIVKGLENAYKFHFFLGGKRSHYPKDLEETISKLPPIRRLSCVWAEDGIITPPTIASYSASFLSQMATDDKNDSSLVLKIQKDDLLILFTGDATSATTDPILKGEVENTTIMIANHHGSGTYGSNDTRWIDKTMPEVVVFSAAVSSHKHPDSDVVRRIYGSPRLRKEEIHDLSYSKDSIEDMRPEFSTYYRKVDHHRALIRKSLFNTTNEGTMVIKLDNRLPHIRPEKPFFSMFPIKHLVEIDFSNAGMVNEEFLVIIPKTFSLGLLERFLLHKNKLKLNKNEGTPVITVVKDLLGNVDTLKKITLWEQEALNETDLREGIADAGLFAKLTLIAS